MTKGFLGLAALAVCLVACVGVQAQPELIAPTPMCSTPDICEMKWAAARRWVTENMRGRLMTYTETFMETHKGASSASPYVRVSKEPQGNGIYKIVADFMCENMFGCVPTVSKALNAFNVYVNDAHLPAMRNPALQPDWMQ